MNSRPADLDPAARPEIEVVPSTGLEAVRPEWSALWRRSPAATPFQAPEWLLPWARHFAPDRAAAVTLRHEGRLVGLLPVFTWEGAVLLAGTGPSDYGDLVLEGAYHAAVPALIGALEEFLSETYDRLDCQQLPPGSPLVHAPAPPDWTDEALPGEACLVAPILGPDGFEAASARRRANWRYALRRIEREGGAFGLVPPSATAQAVEDLIRLHELRWNAKGESGVFADPLLRAFLRDAAPQLAAAGLLRLHELRLGGARAALLMVLVGKNTHHYYIGGFDPEQARLSPSAALVGVAMRQAFREGASEFDFLRGDEPYKADWGARPRSTHRRIFTPLRRAGGHAG